MTGDEQVTVTIDLEDGYRFAVDFGQEGVPPYTVDEPPPLGGGEGPNPARLLAAATGSCLAASMAFCLRKSGVELLGLRAEAGATLVRNERRRWRIGGLAVRLHPEVPAADRGRLEGCLERFEDYCVVTESVRAGIPVDVAVEPAAAREPETVGQPA